jgi:hypothetical protein
MQNIIIKEKKVKVVKEKKEKVVKEKKEKVVKEKSFLDNLNNSNYYGNIEEDDEEIEENKTEESIPLFIEESNVEEEFIPSQSSIDLLDKIIKKTKGKKNIVVKTDEYSSNHVTFDESCFSKHGSEILGQNTRQLLLKVTQYKNLFPIELKTFKVKNNATEEELQKYIDEMQVIVSVNSIDSFLLDSVLQSIHMIEGVSSYSKKYDISGCSDLLKENKQFHSLAKQIFLKYNMFSKSPPEFQMLMLVSTTAFICRNKNVQKNNNLDDFLNEKI